jgi:hypothetical protein
LLTDFGNVDPANTDQATPEEKLEMTTYRRFTTATVEDTFVITELTPTENHPNNWWLDKIDGVFTTLDTLQGAWDKARAQELPVTVHTLNGATKNLGVVFNPEVFERRAYSGYVGYGLSMTDGWYSPIDFDAWVKAFRRFPAEELARENDFHTNALPLYLEALKLRNEYNEALAAANAS